MIVAWNNLMLMGRICGSFIHVKVLVNGEVLCLGLLTICDTQSMLSFGFLVLLIFPQQAIDQRRTKKPK